MTVVEQILNRLLERHRLSSTSEAGALRGHSMITGVFLGAPGVHHGRLHLLVQWQGLALYASGSVPLSITEFSL